MKILSNHISRTVANSTLSTLIVLLALKFVFSMVEETGDFGTGTYDFIKASYFILLTMPFVIYEMLPMALLMGTLLGLGQLAGTSELVAMRAAGVSVMRIAGSVMQLGVLMLVLTFAMGELIVPAANKHAQQVRTVALKGDVATVNERGLWLRAVPYYLHIDEALSGGYLRNVELFRLAADQSLLEIIHAEEVVVRERNWELNNLTVTKFNDKSVDIVKKETDTYAMEVDPGLFTESAISPEQLPLFKLPKYIDYFQSNGLETGKYELAMWLKIVAPLSNLVMILLAVPFAFGSLRSAGNGQRMVVGVFIGLGYALSSRMVNQLGLTYGFSPFICAVLPLSVFFAAALINLRRVR